MSLHIKNIRNKIIYCTIRAYISLLNLIPRKGALCISSRLGVFAYLIAHDARRLTLANLSLIYGGSKSKRAIRELAKKVFWELGRNFVDVARMPSISIKNVDELVTIRGLDNLKSAYGQGKGVIAVSGHLGNFELLGRYLALKGFNVTVVAAPLYDPHLDSLLLENRAYKGFNVVKKKHAISAISQALKKGHIVGLLVDQDTKESGVILPFLGVPARTTIGPAILAARLGSPILPMAIHRKPDDSHLITVKPPRDLTGRSREELQKTTINYTKDLEGFIRTVPEQWLWMHDRWQIDQ